jgi:hypothetical protein
MQLLDEHIDPPGTGAVAKRRAKAAVRGITGVIRGTAMIADTHAPSAGLAVDKALQQRGALASSPGMGQVAAIVGQDALVLLEFLDRNVSRVVRGQKHPQAARG